MIANASNLLATAGPLECWVRVAYSRLARLRDDELRLLYWLYALVLWNTQEFFILNLRWCTLRLVGYIFLVRDAITQIRLGRVWIYTVSLELVDGRSLSTNVRTQAWYDNHTCLYILIWFGSATHYHDCYQYIKINTLYCVADAYISNAYISNATHISALVYIVLIYALYISIYSADTLYMHHIQCMIYMHYTSCTIWCIHISSLYIIMRIITLLIAIMIMRCWCKS